MPDVLAEPGVESLWTEGSRATVLACGRLVRGCTEADGSTPAHHTRLHCSAHLVPRTAQRTVATCPADSHPWLESEIPGQSPSAVAVPQPPETVRPCARTQSSHRGATPPQPPAAIAQSTRELSSGEGAPFIDWAFGNTQLKRCAGVVGG